MRQRAMTRRRVGAWLEGAALLAPLVILYLAFLGVPVAFVIRDALLESAPGPPGFLQTIGNRTYLTVLWRTVEISLVTTGCVLLLGFPLAYVMWRAGPRLASVLMVAVLFPYWTSVVVRAYGWQVLLQRGAVVPTVLGWLGIVPAGTQLSSSRVGLYLGLVQILLPYLVLPVLATLSRLDRQLLEAAYTAGARPVVAVWTIIIPLAAPGIAVGSLIVFAIASGSFVIPALLGGLGDTMLAQVIALQTSELLNWRVGTSLSVLLVMVTLVIMTLITLLGRRHLRVYR